MFYSIEDLKRDIAIWIKDNYKIDNCLFKNGEIYVTITDIYNTNNVHSYIKIIRETGYAVNIDGVATLLECTGNNEDKKSEDKQVKDYIAKNESILQALKKAAKEYGSLPEDIVITGLVMKSLPDSYLNYDARYNKDKNSFIEWEFEDLHHAKVMNTILDMLFNNTNFEGMTYEQYKKLLDKFIDKYRDTKDLDEVVEFCSKSLEEKKRILGVC